MGTAGRDTPVLGSAIGPDSLFLSFSPSLADTNNTTHHIQSPAYSRTIIVVPLISRIPIHLYLRPPLYLAELKLPPSLQLHHQHQQQGTKISYQQTLREPPCSSSTSRPVVVCFSTANFPVQASPESQSCLPVALHVACFYPPSRCKYLHGIRGASWESSNRLYRQ